MLESPQKYHRYRITCEDCGQGGMVNLSILPDDACKPEPCSTCSGPGTCPVHGMAPPVVEIVNGRRREVPA